METQSWLVKVFLCGKHVRDVFVPMASDALDACDQAEELAIAALGLKTNVACVLEDGHLHAVRWNGLCFQARRL